MSKTKNLKSEEKESKWELLIAFLTLMDPRALPLKLLHL
jgi:hypothetical protein